MAIRVVVFYFFLWGCHADRPSNSKCYLIGGKGGKPAPFHDDNLNYYSKYDYEDCNKIPGINRWLDNGKEVGGLRSCCDAAQEYFRCITTADYSRFKPQDGTEGLPPIPNLNKFLVYYYALVLRNDPLYSSLFLLSLCILHLSIDIFRDLFCSFSTCVLRTRDAQACGTKNYWTF